jgi:hypothetical protein
LHKIVGVSLDVDGLRFARDARRSHQDRFILRLQFERRLNIRDLPGRHVHRLLEFCESHVRNRKRVTPRRDIVDVKPPLLVGNRIENGRFESDLRPFEDGAAVVRHNSGNGALLPLGQSLLRLSQKQKNENE